MNLFEKLLEIQKGIDALTKDSENKSDKYSYVSSDLVLNTIRPKMNELKLLLVPATTAGRVIEGVTKSGTTRYLTEIDKLFIWIDCETGERFEVPFYAQGTDLAGEKGVGKAETYAEKYFLLKFFHVPTNSDDPDSDGRTKAGEKPQRGTRAAKETAAYHRTAITQMLDNLCEGDAEKIKASVITFTKNDARQYAGVDNIDKISIAALPVVYANIKKVFKKRTGADFVLEANDDSEAN